MVSVGLLSHDETEAICLEVAACPAFFEKLDHYQKQCLFNYVEETMYEFNNRSEDEREYFRLLNPIYDAAQKVSFLFSTTTESTIESISTSDIPAEHRLSLRQVALLYIFDGKLPIRRGEQANAVAVKHGYTSGDKLYDHYRKLSKKTGITGVSEAQIPTLIKDIETVLVCLPKDKQQAAKEALDTLRRA